jgi:hypothetical protein
MADRAGIRSSLVPISWWPGKYRLSVIVPRARAAADYSKINSLVDTTYANFFYSQDDLLSDYGTWTFGEVLNSPDSDDSMIFIWNPTISDVVSSTPFLTYYTATVYPWPDVLEDLQFVQDSNGVALRRVFREGVSASSIVQVNEYVSATPFSRKRLQTNEPIPTEIQGDYNGFSVSISKCLHPRVDLLSVSSDSSTVYDAIPNRTFPRQGKRKRYEATNHVSWKKHKFHAKVDYDSGLYHLVEMIVTPPNTSRLTYA